MGGIRVACMVGEQGAFGQVKWGKGGAECRWDHTMIFPFAADADSVSGSPA
jgi:hypothetical protein